MKAACPVAPRTTGSRVRIDESAHRARAGPSRWASQKVFPRHSTTEALPSRSGLMRLIPVVGSRLSGCTCVPGRVTSRVRTCASRLSRTLISPRSEEHTSELQSRGQLVCRLLLEQKQQLTADAQTEREQQ